jgi:hypothetical protein
MRFCISSPYLNFCIDLGDTSSSYQNSAGQTIFKPTNSEKVHNITPKLPEIVKSSWVKISLQSIEKKPVENHRTDFNNMCYFPENIRKLKGFVIN